MSITPQDLLEALSGMTPDQRQQLLDLSRPKLNVVPGPRTHLRQMPSDTYAAPHFTHETVWRDELANGSEYPRLLWSAKGQEVTAHDASEEGLLMTKGYTRERPGAADPVDALKALYDGLSDEDKAYMREFEQKQRRAALEAALGGLTPDQIASVSSVPVKKGARA